MADPMICATTGPGKKALAAILEKYDPDCLSTLKALSAAIGGTSAVYYRSDDPETMAAVVAAYAAAKEEYRRLRSKNP